MMNKQIICIIIDFYIIINSIIKHYSMKPFYHLSLKERRDHLINRGLLTQATVDYLIHSAPESWQYLANDWIENCIGAHALPLGIVLDIPINDQSCHGVLAVEETSIIAALNKTIKWVKTHGKLTTSHESARQIGQVTIPGQLSASEITQLNCSIPQWIHNLNADVAYSWHKRGGGVTDITYHPFEDFFQLHVHVNPLDAMGANRTNQICGTLSKLFSNQFPHQVLTCILSNQTHTCTEASITLNIDDPILAERIVFLNHVALSDPYRAATHNKGIMNAIEPVLIATGNDWRAASTAIHSYAARLGQYQALTQWTFNGQQLIGTLRTPIPLGIVGGVTKQHPGAQLALSMMNIQHADQLAQRACALGLLQNLAALKALVSDGITPGHMKLHINNILQHFDLPSHTRQKVKEQAINHLNKYGKMNHSIIEQLIQDCHT